MAASSSALRRLAVLTAAGGTYVGAVYLTYQFMTVREDPALKSQQNVDFSFVRNPLRTETFQSIAPSYDDQIGRDEKVMGINLLRRALLYFHARGKCLEVGAGTGRNIDYYPLASEDDDNQKVTKVVLSDSSDQMILRAKEKLKHNTKGRFDILVADASDLNMFNDNTFDTVVDTFGLCSFDDPVAVLKEMQRVCKKDGQGKILLLEHGRSKSYQGLTNYLDKYAERHAENWG